MGFGKHGNFTAPASAFAMPIKRAIPGQLREQEMQAIEILASLVPAKGVIIEVGSLLGLSSWIWAKSADPTVTVYCIDPWEDAGGSNFINLARSHQQSFTRAQFIENTSDCGNIVPLQGRSPADFQDWDRKIDLYFEDAVHVDPILSQNVDFWSQHLMPDGILCGHDYHPNFPDVRGVAARNAKSLGRTLHVIGTLWYLLPRSMDESKDPVIASKLDRLTLLREYTAHVPPPEAGEDAKTYTTRVVKHIAAFDVQIRIKGAPTHVKQGQTLLIDGTIENVSGSDWPVIAIDKAVLHVGAELRSMSGQKLSVARAFLNKPLLRAGESTDFTIDIDTSKALPGEAEVAIDLVYDYVTWFSAKAASETIVTIRIQPAFEFDKIDPNIDVSDKRFWLQHVKEFSPSTEIGIEVVQEQDYLINTTAGEVPAKSMLTSYELALLFSLARHYYDGRGKIVDLGPLVGVGTNALARGVALNKLLHDRSRVIFSYDLFLMERMDHFLPSAYNPGTGSVFEKFLNNNIDFINIICPVPGDITKTRWSGEPIEILFVDLAKSWELNNHVVKEFFPYLIPGHSIVIQQDYVHVGEPWVALQMELFRDYFELIYFVYGATAVYLLKKKLPADLLATDARTLADAEIDAHFARARQHAPPAVAEVLKCCQAAIKTERGDLNGAQQLLDTIDVRIADASARPWNFVPAIPANLAAASRWLSQARRAAETLVGSPVATHALSHQETTMEAVQTNAAPVEGLTHSQLIHGCYLGILGRDPDPVGLQGWTDRLTSEPIHRLPAALVNSSEFLIGYMTRMVKRDGKDAVARINNRLSFATLGSRLHAERCRLVAEMLPKARHVLDLGGASATDEGALIQMGFRGAEKITIVDLPPDIRFKKALERVETGTYFGTNIEYIYHSMSDLSAYKDESFDLIWSGQTIEHVTLEEGDEIFRQAERILKPGGVFALDTPNRTLTRLAVGESGFIHAEHKYEYRYEEMMARRASSALRLVDAKGLIEMPRSLQIGYLLPDEIETGSVNDNPESSFVFFVAFQRET